MEGHDVSQPSLFDEASSHVPHRPTVEWYAGFLGHTYRRDRVVKPAERAELERIAERALIDAELALRQPMTEGDR